VPAGGLVEQFSGDLYNLQSKAIALSAALPAVPYSIDLTAQAMEYAAEAAREKLARGLLAAADSFDALARTASLAGHDTIAMVLSIGAQTLDNMRNAEGGVMKAAAALDGLAEVAAATGHKTTASLMSVGQSVLQALGEGSPFKAAMAAAMGLITTFADKIFKLEGKKVNDLRDSFFAAAGGFEELHKKLIEAGADATFTKLWTAGTVKDWEAAVKDANAALEKLAVTQGKIADLQQQLADRQTMDWKKAEELATKYGGTLSGLGGQFEAAKLHAAFEELWNDWESLEDMGGDVGGMLTMMKEEVGHLVTESKRIGAEIPEQFKPVIEDLIRTGQLFDDNGVAITDMSGMKFGGPLVSEVDKIVKAIQDLTDALRGKLIPEIESIPRKIEIGVGYRYDPYNPPGGGGGEGGEEGRYSYATGTPGLGFVDFGGGTTVRLHGREAVIPERAVSSGSLGSVGAGTSQTIVVQLDSRVLIQAVVRGMPRELALQGLGVG